MKAEATALRGLSAISAHLRSRTTTVPNGNGGAGSLPMIPDRFGIKLIEDSGIKRQFGVIKSLIEQADEVINCGDAGQEGELIQRWVMQKAECRKPVKRLWISSLTDDAIKDGFSHLREHKDLEPLYTAGLCRAIGDWILGLNATRLYTIKYGLRGTVLSIGRVQTLRLPWWSSGNTKSTISSRRIIGSLRPFTATRSFQQQENRSRPKKRGRSFLRR